MHLNDANERRVDDNIFLFNSTKFLSEPLKYDIVLALGRNFQDREDAICMGDVSLLEKKLKLENELILFMSQQKLVWKFFINLVNAQTPQNSFRDSFYRSIHVEIAEHLHNFGIEFDMTYNCLVFRSETDEAQFNFIFSQMHKALKTKFYFY